MKQLPSVLISVVLGAASAQVYAQAIAEKPSLKDPIELCGKLAGVERDICQKQAREGPARDAMPGTGATLPGASGSVGSKPDDEKRGNTPPGKSRSGDGPAAGAIADPAGVTKR